MRVVQDDKAQAAHREEQTRGQALHYVLAVDSVGHESDRPGVTLLVDRRADGRRLHYHVIYDT